MWEQFRGPERYADLFRALGDIYGAPPGPVLRLHIPVGSEFREASKYSKNEAFLMNVLYDAGGRYECFPGGYYRGVVRDTETGAEVSVQSVLAKLGRREHEQAAKEATPAAIAAKLREMKYTTASEKEGGGKGVSHTRFIEIDEITQTAIDLKPTKRNEYARKTAQELSELLEVHLQTAVTDQESWDEQKHVLERLIAVRKRSEAEEVEKDAKRTPAQRLELQKRRAFESEREEYARSKNGRFRTFEQLRYGISWTLIDKLADAINEDPVRQNSAAVDNSGMMLVVSRDPIDIATMSTNRNWSGTSCLCLEYDRKHARGGNAHFIPNMVKFGAIVIYGCRASDRLINNPINRMTLLPFVNDADPTDVIMLPTSRRYGEPFPGFMMEMHRLLDKINAGNAGGKYSTPKKYQFYDRDVANEHVAQPVWSQDKNIEEELKKLGVKQYTIREDGRVDVDGDVHLEFGFSERELGQLPIKFGRVTGSFTISSTKDRRKYDPDWYLPSKQIWNLTSRCANLDISSVNLLTLKGFPEYVGVDLDISGVNCESLVGCTPEVGRHFIAMKLKSCENLLGGPRKVGGNYDVSHSSIKETRGLDGVEIGGSLVLNFTKVTHLTGRPAHVGLDVELSMSELRSTLGLPSRIPRSLYMRKVTSLVTLRGMPEHVGENVSISMCHNVKSLKGIENTEIMQDFWFNDGGLTKLDYAPKHVGGDMQLNSHLLPRGTEKPASVCGKLLLGRKDDGSDFVQRNDSDEHKDDLAALGVDFKTLTNMEDYARLLDPLAT